MKKIFCSFLLLLFMGKVSLGQEKDSIEASVINFFQGLSDMNPAALKMHATIDFLLLENGHVWNMDTLLSKVNAQKSSGISRLNKFQFIQTDQSGSIAWVSYHNTADFSLKEKQQTVRWLESAVLRKEAGKWKIALLHSTRVVPPRQSQ